MIALKNLPFSFLSNRPYDFLRAKFINTAEAGENVLDLYTVPIGRVLFLESVAFQCYQADPSQVAVILKKNLDYFTIEIKDYGEAYSCTPFQPFVYFDETEIVQVRWMSCAAGNTLINMIIGYLLFKS